MKKEEIAKLIESVGVDPDVNQDTMDIITEDAIKYGFCRVVVPFCAIPYVTEKLEGTSTGYSAPISSPSGLNDTTEMKIELTKECIKMSKVPVDIDMVINLYYVQSGMFDLVEKDVRGVREAFPDNTLKVVIEATRWDDETLKKSCAAVIDGGADYIKTTTGSFGPTTVELVKKIRDYAGYNIGIKAAGGIRTKETIEQMVDLGVDRIGMNYRSAHELFTSLD